MKEIGGYLEFEQNKGELFYPDLIRLNTGRNALAYLLECKSIKRLYFPKYMCDSCSTVLQEHNVSVSFYDISERFEPILDGINSDEYIYVVNYFGQISNEMISKIKSVYVNLIVDNTQSFFQKPVDGVDTFYTCRKFFGVPDGAFLHTDLVLKRNLEQDVSRCRMSHILGRYEVGASSYYSDYLDSEEKLGQANLAYMSKITENILRGINYVFVESARRNNFRLLAEALAESNKLVLDNKNATFMYPFFTKNGQLIREKLLKHRVYTPTLWPNMISNEENDSYSQFVKNTVILPIDQRYSDIEMNYMINIIKDNI